MLAADFGRHPIRFEELSLSKASYILFFTLTLVSVSLSPGTVRGMGYKDENIKASNQIHEQPRGLAARAVLGVR
jgi:hypothetical protein